MIVAVFLIRAGNLSARGGLTIDNGGNDDAVVTLAKKGRCPAVSVYVRRGRKYTVKGVPDGSYTVFFTGGATGSARRGPSGTTAPSSVSKTR